MKIVSIAYKSYFKKEVLSVLGHFANLVCAAFNC